MLSRGGRMPMPQVRDVLEAGMAGAGRVPREGGKPAASAYTTAAAR